MSIPHRTPTAYWYSAWSRVNLCCGHDAYVYRSVITSAEAGNDVCCMEVSSVRFDDTPAHGKEDDTFSLTLLQS